MISAPLLLTRWPWPNASVSLPRIRISSGSLRKTQPEACAKPSTAAIKAVRVSPGVAPPNTTAASFSSPVFKTTRKISPVFSCCVLPPKPLCHHLTRARCPSRCAWHTVPARCSPRSSPSQNTASISKKSRAALSTAVRGNISSSSMSKRNLLPSSNPRSRKSAKPSATSASSAFTSPLAARAQLRKGNGRATPERQTRKEHTSKTLRARTYFRSAYSYRNAIIGSTRIARRAGI